MQYGDVKLNTEVLYLYLGTDPANDNLTYVDDNSLWAPSKAVNQRDADLLHFWHKVCIAIQVDLSVFFAKVVMWDIRYGADAHSLLLSGN